MDVHEAFNSELMLENNFNGCENPLEPVALVLVLTVQQTASVTFLLSDQNYTNTLYGYEAV